MRAWVVGPPPLVRELDWCEHAEGGVGAVGVVLGAPVGDEHLGFEERVELFDAQQLVAYPAAVGLDPGFSQREPGSM
jgi:hypothetical protein